jgi:MFS family permease
VAKAVRDHRTVVLVALMLTMALVAMDTTIVATALPQVVGDLGGFALVGWVFSVYLLAQTVTIPVYGKLADLYGRKPVLVIGIVVFLIGSALSAASWDMLSLICFRALQGLGAGSIGATVSTVAGDLYDVRERGRVQGWLASVWGISAVVAPLLGGVFAEYVSWRWIFLVNLPIGALALGQIVRGLHENVQRHERRIDYAGAALVLVTTGLLIFGLLQGGTAWSWLSPASFTVFGAALVAGAVAVRVEMRAPEAIMPPWLWKRRLIAGCYAATIVSGLLIIGVSTFLPTWAQTVLGLDAVEAGFVLGIMSITWPLASALSARLYLRIGFRDTALIGALLTVAAGIVFTATPADTSVAQPVCASAVMGAGLGLLSTPLIVGLQSEVGWSERGVITGGVMFSRYFGQSLGAAIFGAITNSILLNHLNRAPGAIRAQLPHTVDGISHTLDGHPDRVVAQYLREAMHASTHGVFVGLLVAAVATGLALLVVPRGFTARPESEAEPAPDSTAASADRG